MLEEPNKLEFIGYYRLSGYSYAFRKSPYNDNFVAGTEFKNIIELYKFDRKLKLILLDAIERIEIALRVALTYCLAEKSVSYGEFYKLNFKNLVTKRN